MVPTFLVLVTKLYNIPGCRGPRPATSNPAKPARPLFIQQADNRR
jgi:hypothetical protein